MKVGNVKTRSLKRNTNVVGNVNKWVDESWKSIKRLAGNVNTNTKTRGSIKAGSVKKT